MGGHPQRHPPVPPSIRRDSVDVDGPDRSSEDQVPRCIILGVDREERHAGAAVPAIKESKPEVPVVAHSVKKNTKEERIFLFLLDNSHKFELNS